MNYRDPFLALLLVGVFVSCTHDHKTVTNNPGDVKGCKDAAALNYNAAATVSDSTTCKYAIDSVTGKYTVTDTAYGSPYAGVFDTIISTREIVATRISYNEIHFDSIILCNDCYPAGSISYSAATRTFNYEGNSTGGYYGSQGNGSFVGDTIYYYAGSWNNYGLFPPHSRGRGVKHQ